MVEEPARVTVAPDSMQVVCSMGPDIKVVQGVGEDSGRDAAFGIVGFEAGQGGQNRENKEELVAHDREIGFFGWPWVVFRVDGGRSDIEAPVAMPGERQQFRRRTNLGGSSEKRWLSLRA